MSKTIVVLVPGTTGSTLVGPNQAYDALAPIWPIAVGVDLKSSLLQEYALPELERTDLRPGGLTGMTGGSGAYYAFVQQFGKLGYTWVPAQYTGGPGAPVQDWGLPADTQGSDLLVTWPYDWRQDCTASAQQLQSFLGTVDALYAADGYQLFLVGHSMGGLVCRAYLENVGINDAWRQNIAGLITLGTPHLGAPLALSAIMGQLGQAGFIPPKYDTAAAQTLVHNFLDTSFSDSSFELLPPPVLESAAPTQYIQDGGASYNLFDRSLPAEVATAVETAANQNLQSASQYTERCQQAQAFFATLDYTGTRSASLPPYYCAYGTPPTNGASEQPTLAGFTYASGALTPQTSADGDEIVPAWSASFTGRPVKGSYSAPGVSHFQLPADSDVLAWVAARVSGTSGLRVDKVVGVGAEVPAGG